MGYLYQENELQINIFKSLRFRMFLDERFSLPLEFQMMVMFSRICKKFSLKICIYILKKITSLLSGKNSF